MKKLILLVILLCFLASSAFGFFRLGFKPTSSSAVSTGDAILWDASGDKIFWDASTDEVLWD